MTFRRADFVAQVPDWLTMSKDFVVLASGVVEMILGLSLVALYRQRVWVGLVVAIFFVAIFPGNIISTRRGSAPLGSIRMRSAWCASSSSHCWSSGSVVHRGAQGAMPALEVLSPISQSNLRRSPIGGRRSSLPRCLWGCAFFEDIYIVCPHLHSFWRISFASASTRSSG